MQNNGQAPLALREGDWVLIEKGGPLKPLPPQGKSVKPAAAATHCELYNLANDLTQKDDLAAKEPARVKAMAARLDDIRTQGRSRPD